MLLRHEGPLGARDCADGDRRARQRIPLDHELRHPREVRAVRPRGVVTLRDDRCGCNADNDDRDWTGYWAVMRVERPGRENLVRFEVWAKAVKSHADEPTIRQLL